MGFLPRLARGLRLPDSAPLGNEAIRVTLEETRSDQPFPNRDTGRMKHLQFTGVIEREGDGYVSLCPELDIASQGDSIEEARRNLVEALELLFEAADESEISRRLSG